jgi:hypothetical protein
MEQTANAILDRAIRVAKLDLPVFRAIARDPNATREAAVVVAVVAIATGIGALFDSLGAVVLSIVAAFLGWFIFSAMTYFFGKNVFGTPTTQVNVESLLRTQGYALAPRVLSIVGFVPILGWAVAAVGWFWALVTAVVAIRETLAISTGRAVIVGVVALIATWIVGIILAIVFNVDIDVLL